MINGLITGASSQLGFLQTMKTLLAGTRNLEFIQWGMKAHDGSTVGVVKKKVKFNLGAGYKDLNWGPREKSQSDVLQLGYGTEELGLIRDTWQRRNLMIP